jgi:hypothetical protein
VRVKGCAFAALRDLLLFLASAAAFVMVILKKGGGVTDAIGPSLLCGGILWIGLKLLFGIAHLIREKAMLGRRHAPPADGELCALSGTIHAVNPLQAPLSGVNCAAFRYTISAIVGRGKNRTIAPIYEGVAITPSTLRTRAGSYRLLAVPTFDFESELLDTEAAQRNARIHIERTKFEKPRPAGSKSRSAEEWSDDDGAYRYEVSHTETLISPEEWRFEEFVMKPGEEVTIFGRYSVERGGILADANWANKTRVMKGNADLILAALNRRIRSYFIWGVFFTAASAGVFMLISAH